MTYPWFRWYRGTCSDTKFRLIALEYGVPTAVVVGAWAALLECVTERHGTVTLASSHASHKKVCQYLQASLDLPEKDSVDVVDGLIWQGLITETDGKVSVVNWEKRQTFDTTGAERAKRYRERKRHGTVTPSSRDTDTDTESYTDSPPIVPPKGTKKKASNYTDDFELFWKAYPRKVGKGAAAKAWGKATQRHPGKQIIEAAKNVSRQVDEGRDKKYVKHPATWLNADGWHDEDEETPGSKWERIDASADRIDFGAGEAGGQETNPILSPPIRDASRRQLEHIAKPINDDTEWR